MIVGGGGHNCRGEGCHVFRGRGHDCRGGGGSMIPDVHLFMCKSFLSSTLSPLFPPLSFLPPPSLPPPHPLVSTASQTFLSVVQNLQTKEWLF